MGNFGSDLDLSRDGDILEVQRSVNAIIELADQGRDWTGTETHERQAQFRLLTDIAREAENINFLLFNEPVESHTGLLA